MTLTDIVFLAAALGSVAGGALAVTRRNPLYSAIWLLVSFTGMAVLFYLLAAPFLAMMQVLVYAGAILVLFLFVIMLLNLKPEELAPEAPVWERLFGGALAAALLAVLSVTLTGAGAALVFPPLAGGTAYGTIEGVGIFLFRVPGVLPFELISVLIVVAIAGAVVLARKRL